MAESNDSSSVSTFSFPQAEHEILEFWQQEDIFKRSLDASKDKPAYVFYDGPPFATGLPHHGHLLASTLKDIVPRYFTMNGRYVERRFGWDCHGLPIEHEIDKEYGCSATEVVAKNGIASYNQSCRDIVQRYAAEWRQTITRLGRWVDFDNDYKTMDCSFMESVWWVVKSLWEKDLIYYGTKVMPFSTALGTGLSNFEAGSNYQQVQDPALMVLFKLLDEDNTFLAVWTTTPWTLPSNLGVCVNPDLTYLKVEQTDFAVASDSVAAKNNSRFLYVAKECLPDLEKKFSLKIISECLGSDLQGKNYQPLFDYFSSYAADGAFIVHTDDYVTATDGTGLVHMAPAFGEDDARVMQNSGWRKLVCPVDQHGFFTDEVVDFAGLEVKAADKAIIARLKKQGSVLDQATIVHSYPFCPRSDTPLIYRAVPSWYVKVESIKNNIINNNEKINWVPEHIKHGRFGNWLHGARDWAISRNRYWGTPIPLWKNDITKNIICIGSIAELKKYSGVVVEDLHRDTIDVITFTIPGEEGVYRRVEEVLDCWFESGAMPYAQKHYPFENKQDFDASFPAEFIAEGLDQTRGWFYLLSVLSTALFNKPAFKNVIVNGIVMAEDGKKMSKRLRNYTPPGELMEAYGADALRLYLINSSLVRGEEQRFSDQGVKDMVRRTLLPWYNAFKFFHTYAEVDCWRQSDIDFKYLSILDRWIMSRLHSLLDLIATHMHAYKLYNIVPELLLFIDDLTNTYIRLNRSRFWGEEMSTDKSAAYYTLFNVLQQFSKVMAPFAPFLSENIYRKLQPYADSALSQEISVHLCSYPKAENDNIIPALEQAVSRMQKILVLGRQCRNDNKIKIKTPLRSLSIIHDQQSLLDEIKKLAPVIKKELNVKEIIYCNDEDKYIELYAKPNSPVLGKRLQQKFSIYRKLIESLPGKVIRALEDDGAIELQGEKFSESDLLIFRKAKPGSNVLTDRSISIILDTTLDAALVDEGLAREVINRIQKQRKDDNLHVADRISVTLHADDVLARVVTAHQEYIKTETLCLQLNLQPIINNQQLIVDDNIDGHPYQIVIEVATK